MLADSTGSPSLLGIAAVVTAAGGFLGAVAATIAAFRKDRPPKPLPAAPPEDDRGKLWVELLERLDASEEERLELRRQLEECNNERLDLLRDRAKQRRR